MQNKPSCKLTVAAVLVLSVLTACEGDRVVIDTDGQIGELDEKELGLLRVPLITSDEATHRLRHATFGVRNASASLVATLDAELDPDATQLTTDLGPGSYNVTLASGWGLERIAEDGTVVPVNAALVTPNPASVQIRNGLATELVYTFTTADGQISLGAGGLSISVDVVRPESLTSCNLLGDYYGSGCPENQTCLLADDTGRTFCASPGSLPIGSACSSQQCVRGAQCLAEKPGEATRCMQFCNPTQVTFGCNCAALGINDQVGICIAPPPGTCDLLLQSGCESGEVCQYLGGNFGTCGIPGSTQRNEPCLGEVCAAGLDCYGDDPQTGGLGRCRAFCDLDRPSCERPDAYYSYCESAGTGRVGRCYDYN